MRPVNRGPRGDAPLGYPYNIDMASQAQLQATLDGYHDMRFTAAAVVKLFGVNYPTMWQQLFAWLCLTQARVGELAFKEADLELLTAAVKTIVDRNGPEYRKAANQLIRNLGRTCAYCEKPNPSPLPVEHMVPKDNFPLFSVSWDNFLLACSVCNTAGTGKGTGPTRATVRGWSADPIADQLDYFARCRAFYLWPDNPDAYRTMPPRLEYWSLSGHGWQPVPSNLSVHPDIKITAKTYATRTVDAKVYLDHHHRSTRQVRVVYAPTTHEAVNAIGYLGLDQRGGGNDPVNPTTSDGRQYDRTRAWFSIVHLLNQYPGSESSRFASWWDSVLELAEDLGNFSVWVRVLDLLDYRDTFGRSLLNYFLYQSSERGSFPGTSMGRIP